MSDRASRVTGFWHAGGVRACSDKVVVVQDGPVAGVKVVL